MPDARLAFSHRSIFFESIAEDWNDQTEADASCKYLQDWVRLLDRKETESLYSSLVQSDSAFEGDQIWQTPILRRLLEIQTATCTRDVGPAHAQSDNSRRSTCRLIPLPS